MPAEYDAGAAKSRWEMDISPVRQGVLEIKRLAAEARQALDGAQQAPARGTSTVVPRSEAPNAIPVGSGPGIDRAAVAAAKLAAEQQKAALAGQRLATEQQRTAIQMANVERAETQAAAAALRLSQQQERATASASKGRSGFSQLAQTARGLQSTLGAVGVGLGLGALAQGTVAAGQAASRYGQTINLTRELAGTQDTYNLVMRAANEQQRLYGGSLQENIAGLSGLVITARSSGAELEQLINLSQRLALLDPSQGTEGARIALSEALSGDPRSLAMRYEIPRSALEKLKDEGLDAAQRLGVLDSYLNNIGITTKAVTSTVTDSAIAYNQLGAQADAAYMAIGNAANVALVPVMRFMTSGLEGFNRLVSAGQRVADIQAQIVAQAGQSGGGYDAYRAQAQAVDGQLVSAGQRLPTLTRAQYDYAQALVATGQSEQQALAAAQARGPVLNQLNAFIATATTEGNKNAAQLADLGPIIIAAAAASDQSAAAMLEQIGAYNRSEQSAATLREAILAIDGAQRAQAQATAEASREAERNAQLLTQGGDAARQAAAASNADAVAKIEQSTQTALASARQDELQAALERAAASSGTAAQLAAQLAATYDGTEAPALARIIGLLREKTALEGGADASSGGTLSADAAAAASGYTDAYVGRTRAESARAKAEAAQQAAIAQARRDQLLATGSATQIVAQRQREYNDAVAQYGAGSAEAIQAETALIQARQSAASASTKAATSADKAATKTASAANAEAVAQRDALRRIEDLYQDHYDKLRRLDEDYQLSSSRKAEDYQLERQRLLAEGKIAEANLLEQKYTLQKKRDEEDAARARQREQEQAAQQIADAQEQAGLKASDRERKRALSGTTLAGDAGTAAAVDAAGARQAQADALAAGAGAAAARGASIQLQVQIAPTAVQIDGGQIVTIIWPQVSQMIDAALTEGLLGVALTAPPATTSGGVGGPTP